MKKCKIKYPHDFRDYPCKKCSPINWYINKITPWVIVIAIALLTVYCLIW